MAESFGAKCKKRNEYLNNIDTLNIILSKVIYNYRVCYTRYSRLYTFQDEIEIIQMIN